MPVITNIKAQQRRKNRYSIYVDGKYSFSLSELDLAAAELRVGGGIDETRINELRSASELGKLKDAGYRYLSYRPRSVKEFRDHLVRKDWPESAVDLVIEEFRAHGYLNDEQFAKDWVANRQTTSPRSARGLQAELRQKGVAADLIEEVLADLENPVETIRDLIDAKRLNQRYQGDEQKMTQYLMRQGFRYSVIQSALRDGED